jgi:hypothetical protein
MHEPIDYDEALRDLLRKRSQRRFTTFLRRYIDIRPTSASQVMLFGVVVAVIGWLTPGLHLLATVGLALILFGFVTSMLQPRGRRVTWRNREIDLPPEDNWGHRLYRVLYRRRF